MRRRERSSLTGRLAGVLAAAACLSAAVLTWFGWRAVSEWQHSESLLSERRARDAVDLLVTALGRDMQGVQRSVLSTWWEQLARDSPDDPRNLAATAFARYPYPESFFAWRDDDEERDGRDTAKGIARADMPFFNRWNRRPPWLSAADRGSARFPVTVGHEPAVADAILRRLDADVRLGRQFSVFDLTLRGVPYQIVARLFYRDAFHERLAGLIGFTVNHAWVREHYFAEMAREIARIGNHPPFTIVDDRGQVVVGAPATGATAGATADGSVTRSFPVLFADPRLVSVDSPRDLARPLWQVRANPSADEAFLAATRGADQTLLIAGVAVATLVLGLFMTARAARESAEVARMRSEFVSAVTHELKTPIATIRVIGETLVRGRVADARVQRDYAQLVVQEAKRLARLVENLLAYARVTDAADVYALEPLDLRVIVEEALNGFRPQLTEAGFEVEADMDADLPLVRADHTAMRLVLDNLVDNAIRYAGAARALAIRTRRDDTRQVVLEVRDRGVGIPPEELIQVTRRFYRGRQHRSSGSGLGLTIADRIVADHGGVLAIRSEVGAGTTVTVTLPAARDDDDEADSRR